MKFEFNSDGFDGLLDDLKTFELNWYRHQTRVRITFLSAQQAPQQFC